MQQKRSRATFCEMPACNNGSYAVHILYVVWNNGVMHKKYNKMIQTSNSDTVHRNKTRMCHYVMNTKSMCYIHTLSSNNWTSHMDVLVGGTPNIHRQLHVSSIKIRGKKKHKSLHNDIRVSQQVLTKVSFYTRLKTMSTENMSSNKVNTTKFPWHATSF